MDFGKSFSLAARLGIDDKVDVTLTIQPRFFRAMFGNLGKP